MKIRRNDSCPCGSQRRHKNCCMGNTRASGRGLRPLTIPLQVQSHPTPKLTLQRECDGCSECCGPALMINDPQLISPCGQSCRHRGDAGCEIYEDRPVTCRGYICNYLVEPGLTVEDRPDHVGAIVRMSRDKKLIPPMDRLTFINEAKPAGILHLLRNPRWKKAVTDDLLAAVPIYFTFFGDDTGREVLLVRFHQGRLGCELTSCETDGTPMMIELTPRFDTPLHVALTIPNQGFAFEARTLICQLTGRSEVVIGSSANAENPSPLRFLFTRRQAIVLKALMRLIDVEHYLHGLLPSDQRHPILSNA